MKIQSVNLYTKLAQTESKDVMLNWNQYLILNGIFIAIVTLYFFVYSISVYIDQHKYQNLLVKVNKLEKSFLVSKQLYPDILFDKDASKLINEQEKDLHIKREFLSRMSSKKKITNYLQTFSQTITAHTWLTNIEVTEGGDQIVLSGKALAAKDLNAFLALLVQNKAFEDYILNVDLIDKDSKKDSKTINFKIALLKGL